MSLQNANGVLSVGAVGIAGRPRPYVAWDFLNGPGLRSSIGGASITFARATTRTVIDWENVVRLAASGEACWEGYRRVQNLISFSTEDFTNVNWVSGDVGNPKTPNSTDIAAPDGTFTACKWVLNGGANRSFGSTGISTPSLTGRTHAFSFWVYVPAANVGANFGAYMFNGADIPVDPINLNALPRNTWQRVRYLHTWSAAATNGITAQFHGNFAETNGDTIYVWHPQLDDVTGQSVQSPSEYQSVGVLAAPYQGTGVDGVRYYPFQNGNTVAANVVTEARGAPINPLTVLKGLSIWPAVTNLVLQSENFGTTWTAVGTPTRTAANTRCGDVVLDLIGDDDAGVLEGYTQPVTFTADVAKVLVVYIKQGTATSSVINLWDNTATAHRVLAAVTWSVGVPQVAMTTGTFEGMDTLANGVYRLRFISAAVTAANANVVRIWPASDAAFNVALTGNINVGGVMASDRISAGPHFPYVPTTTATATKNLDDAKVTSIAGFFNQAEGSMVAEFIPGVALISAIVVAIHDGTANEVYEIVCNSARPTDPLMFVVDGGATQVNQASGASVAAGAVGKTFFGYRLNDFGISTNGGTPQTDVAGTLPTVDRLWLGQNPSASQVLEGHFRKFGYVPRKLANELGQGMSA